MSATTDVLEVKGIQVKDMEVKEGDSSWLFNDCVVLNHVE